MTEEANAVHVITSAGLEANPRTIAFCSTLKEYGFMAKVAVYGTIKPPHDSVIFLDPPEGDEEKAAFARAAGKIPSAICLWPRGKAKAPSGWIFTACPDGAAVASILAWSLLSAEIRTDRLLGEFLLESFQILIFLDSVFTVTSALPSSGAFLGRPAGEAVGKKFSDLTALSDAKILKLSATPEVCDIPIEEGGTAAYSILRVSDEIAKTIGYGNSGGVALLLTRVDAYRALEEKRQRLEDIRNRMILQRSLELESANELLQKQAGELNNTLELLDLRNKQMMEELNLASELQKSLLPRTYPQDVPFQFSHKYIPLDVVGGDFFDVVRLSETKIGLIIADVSGHGVGPAFITALFKSSFEHFCRNDLSPAHVLDGLNKEFIQFLRTGHYLTAFYAILDTEKLEITYSNAGHPKQLILRSDGTNEELNTLGFFIGMFDAIEYEEKTAKLSPGDMLVLFSDGIIETTGKDQAQFGREGIIASCLKYRNESIENISNGLFADLMDFMIEPRLEDDITILMIHVIDTL
jgi:serine phosphatase RsbU (regulator of sigma subunit)